MGIFEIFFDDEDEKKRRKEKELEEEMDELGLDEWEKDEVKKTDGIQKTLMMMS